MPAVRFCCWAHQAHRGALLGGVLFCSPVPQVFDGPASLLFSCRGWYVRKQRGYGDGFAFMAARVFSTGISHHILLVHIPSICLSVINSHPHPGIAPQSLNSSSRLLHLPGDQNSSRSMYDCKKKDCLILNPFQFSSVQSLSHV